MSPIGSTAGVRKTRSAPARRAALLSAGLWLACLLAGPAAAADLAQFFGSYVGGAEAENLVADMSDKRDMDVVIEAYQQDGFRVNWVTVKLVDGRRDLPGVQREAHGVLFQPSGSQNFFVEVQPNNPFREREATLPIRGDPIRWARLDGDTLQINSFVVLEDGRYELQTYDRILTEDGLDIRFEAVVDGEVVRRVTGRTVRTS